MCMQISREDVNELVIKRHECGKKGLGNAGGQQHKLGVGGAKR